MLALKNNPPPCPTHHTSVADIPGDWHIAHTKARQEKALAHDLLAAGIDYYLPMVQRETYSGDRRRRNLYPVFTSYLFFAGPPEVRVRVFQTNRVANVLPVADRDRFVREISDIQRVLDAGDVLELVPGFPVGRQVVVTKGPYQGTIGTVTHDRPWTSITLVISTLGVGAELKISGDLLELLDDVADVSPSPTTRAPSGKTAL